jgi:sugar O-acyltransferase (sialic acid O-acetyltransferase NeuD family)
VSGAGGDHPTGPVTELVLIGSGGFARETAEAVRAINARRATWQLLGFLDDDPARHGQRVCGLPVLGAVELVHELPAARVAICTGRPDNYLSRRAIAGRLGLDDDRYATIIHPTATVGTSCSVGSGSVLLAHVDLTADVTVGRHVTIMPQVVVTHDCRVDDWATIAAGVRFGGGCQIGAEAYIGSACAVREGVTVGSRALIGMGSLVLADVPAERLWYGTPARDRGPAPLPVLIGQTA